MGAEREDPRRSAKLQFGMGRDTRTLSGGVRAGCMTQKGKGEPMKLYVLPPSPRALKVIARKNHLGLECEMHIVDLERRSAHARLHRDESEQEGPVRQPLFGRYAQGRTCRRQRMPERVEAAMKE